jgi:hypothetical protein
MRARLHLRPAASCTILNASRLWSATAFRSLQMHRMSLLSAPEEVRGFQAPRRALKLSQRWGFSGQQERSSPLGSSVHSVHAPPRERMHCALQAMASISEGGPVSSDITWSHSEQPRPVSLPSQSTGKRTESRRERTVLLVPLNQMQGIRERHWERQRSGR